MRSHLEIRYNSRESRSMIRKLIYISIALIYGALFWSAAAPPGHAQSDADAQELPTRNQIYMRNLVSLSRIIGSAHAVRVRCNGVDDQYWRAYMVQILGLEAPNRGGLRARMVDGFNIGFEQENRSRRTCDASANQVEARYAAEGRKISEELAAYYFPARRN